MNKRILLSIIEVVALAILFFIDETSFHKINKKLDYVQNNQAEFASQLLDDGQTVMALDTDESEKNDKQNDEF